MAACATVPLMPGRSLPSLFVRVVLGGVGMRRPEQHRERLAGLLQAGNQNLGRRRQKIGLLGEVGAVVDAGASAPAAFGDVRGNGPPSVVLMVGVPSGFLGWLVLRR